MKTGVLLHPGGTSISKSAIKNKMRKALVGRIIWNSECDGQAVRSVGVEYGEYVAAPVFPKKRSKIMARLRKERDRRLKR